MQEALEKLAQEKEKRSGSAGPLIGIAIIVGLLIWGGIYSIMRVRHRAPSPFPAITNDPSADATTPLATTTP